MAEELGDAASKVLAVHGIGGGQPPAKPALWEEFRARPGAEEVSLEIENRFYRGYSHSELDWSRPVHALLVDFKGDGMQLGKLLKRLADRGEQYVFVGNPLPFNGGWHFSAVDDFEDPSQQQQLDPAWRNVRIWHRVNYVATLTEAGAPALTPRETFDAASRHAGALALGPGFRFAAVYLLGGLMPHTLVATALADGGPAAQMLALHLELGATLAAMGHGLDVLLACGSPEHCLLAGCEAAGPERLLKINGLRRTAGVVCAHRLGSGALLVTASHCGRNTLEPWLEAAGLAPVEADVAPPHSVRTTERVCRLDVAALPGMDGARFPAAAGAPNVAVFVDEVADPIEVYTIVAHLMEQGFGFLLVSHSGGGVPRRVTTETVFGNAMYALRDCACVLTTTPADLVPVDVDFDGFFVAGGQCPYRLQDDAAVTGIMDAAPIAAAVCHGPEALAGSKWLRVENPAGGAFISYYGAWPSFRDVLHRYERKKPGEICVDAAGRLFSGNAPNSTKEMAVHACEAIRSFKAAKVGTP